MKKYAEILISILCKLNRYKTFHLHNIEMSIYMYIQMYKNTVMEMMKKITASKGEGSYCIVKILYISI